MVVDTSVWLEIFFNHPLKKRCLSEIKKETCYIPSLCFYEIFKKLRSKASDVETMEAISGLTRFPFLVLTPEISLSASDLSLQHQLSMADSIVLAHAVTLGDTLLTLDNDFDSISQVKIIR